MKTYGNTNRDACPICNSKELSNIWKIPLTTIPGKIIVNDANLNKIPLLNSDTIYSFSQCTECKSILLDPYSSSYWDDRSDTHHADKAIKRELWGSYTERIMNCVKYLNNKETIADVACGGGQCLTVAKEANLGFKNYIGIDIRSDSANYVTSIGFTGITGDVCKSLNFKADFIIFAEAFEHVQNQNIAISNISKALNKDGILYLTAQALEANLPVRPEESVYVNKEALTALLNSFDIEIIEAKLLSGRWKVIARKI